MEINKAIVEAIENVKGERIVAIDLSAIEHAICSHFIICEGGSNTQVGAIADKVSKHVRKELGIRPLGKDGEEAAEWIVIDYGSVMVHIFQRHIRELYNLEALWADGVMSEV